jgi:glycosyltransferase involved in cell wall biosynthesis
MKRLSIIVPVYNVEPYLERCLRSLEDQDIPRDDYEIICINDGSTDNSREVIITIQSEFENIILIDQQNQGVSAARNKGMNISRGEYLMMVDPDDYLKSNALGERLDILTKINPDVGYTGHIILDENMNEEYRFDPLFNINRVLTGIDFNNTYMRGRSEIRAPHSSVGIFFRNGFLNSNNLRYLEGVPFLEDGEFLAKIACLADRVIFINGPVYIITIRSGSATNSRLYYSEKARIGFLKAAKDLLQFKMNYCKTEEKNIFMNQPIVQFTIVYLISYAGLKYLKHYPELFNTLKKGPLKILHTEGSSDFYRKMGNSYNYSIHCFYLTWFLYKVRKSMSIRAKRVFKLDF